MATKYKSRSKRLSDALDRVTDAIEEIEILRDEIEEWKSNMEGTNLENTNKYEQLEECSGELEQLMDDLENAKDSEYNIIFPGMF